MDGNLFRWCLNCGRWWLRIISQRRGNKMVSKVTLPKAWGSVSSLLHCLPLNNLIPCEFLTNRSMKSPVKYKTSESPFPLPHISCTVFAIQFNIVGCVGLHVREGTWKCKRVRWLIFSEWVQSRLTDYPQPPATAIETSKQVAIHLALSAYALLSKTQQPNAPLALTVESLTAEAQTLLLPGRTLPEECKYAIGAMYVLFLSRTPKDTEIIYIAFVPRTLIYPILPLSLEVS